MHHALQIFALLLQFIFLWGRLSVTMYLWMLRVICALQTCPHSTGLTFVLLRLMFMCYMVTGIVGRRLFSQVKTDSVDM